MAHLISKIRRSVAMLLLILVPLQVTLAAVHDYAQHRLDAGVQESALFHSHDHDSHDGDAPATVPDGDLTASTVDHQDEGGHIHVGHAQFLGATWALSPVELTQDAAIFHPQPYPTVSIRRLDRPPLLARR